ncbi:MAG: 16S rRNA (cytidine(1402)-2'-O)-methyltransferase [Pseudomonadota bacterium]|nr:16S rRNA (cytidine(1402)-2'-O)-methyltransferase [Pseudomonadota bacterium]
MVATPIGNLRDLSLRALNVLAEVDRIVAEDTRNTSILLKHHGIVARLLSLHRHNERERAQELIEQLASGASLALVSDAGTPGISDPGAIVVNEVRRAGYAVIPIPGASALCAALSASGMHALPFCFHGFLPAKSSARRAYLENLKAQAGTLIFYEAPHRMVESVADLATVLGAERDAIIARELTKLFETIHGCKLGDASAWLADDANRLKGEFVLMVAGVSPDANENDGELKRVLKLLLAEELPVSQAAKLGAAITGVGKNRAYQQALALRDSSD